MNCVFIQAAIPSSTINNLITQPVHKLNYLPPNGLIQVWRCSYLNHFSLLRTLCRGFMSLTFTTYLGKVL